VKIDLKIVKENKDGSANASVDFDKEGLEFLVQEGILSIITQFIKQNENAKKASRYVKEPRRVRHAQVLRLLGNPRTISEVAKYLRVHKQTAGRYLRELLMLGKIVLYTDGTIPIKYRKVR